ncbi:glycosyltransferase [Candidatus Neomarinimicrobiota bacterium]
MATICVIMPTLNAGNHLEKSLGAILNSPIPSKTLVVDSGSSDSTVQKARALGAEVIIIPKKEFNHGATREMARKLLNTDIVVFITQDAYPNDEHLLERLVSPIISGDAAVAYARQIPHAGAKILEALPREFNYGQHPQLRGIEDARYHGVYTFFCSNSGAAYSNEALDLIGGFKPTLTNEDYFAVAELLIAGYKVAYVPDAVVRHSHRYKLVEEFQRYFDTGYVRAERPWIQELVGAAENRGKDFFLALIKKLAREEPRLIPYALLQTFMKWLGYRFGFYGYKLPLAVKRSFSSQKYYWDSCYYLHKVQ